MKWKVTYSREAKKFIDKNHIHNEIRNSIVKLLKKVKGYDINIDLKKLVGDWEGYYRIRMGKIRVIISISKEDREVYIYRVDYRGDAYN